MNEPSPYKEIQELLQAPDPAALTERAGAMQPFDLAEVLKHLAHDERVKLLTLIDSHQAAEALEYLEPELQYMILHHLEESVGTRLLHQISSDVAVDLLLAVHPRQAQQLKSWLPEEYRKKIDTLMTFGPNTAGSLCTVDYIAVREGWTVEQTLAHIRKVGKEAEVVSYVYVVNARGQLVDVVSLRELILASPGAALAEIVNNDVISVRAETDQEEVARILARYDFIAIPVVDAQHRLIGIVTVDDLVDVIQDEATEDIHKLGGSEPLTDSYFDTKIPVLVKKRIGWILMLFLAEAYTGTVLRHFEHTLSQVVALSFFIPLLIGTGGNTGSQIVSTLVRGLGIGEVTFKDMGRVLLRELVTGAIIGVIMGVATIVRAYTLGVGATLGPVVGVTATFIVLWASIVSAILPLVLHKLKVDPAVVSGPFITTLVDGTGLFMYFTVARIMLGLQ